MKVVMGEVAFAASLITKLQVVAASTVAPPVSVLAAAMAFFFFRKRVSVNKKKAGINPAFTTILLGTL